MAKYLKELFLFCLIISLNFSNGINLDKIEDVDGTTWRTENCHSVRNDISDVDCLPQGLLPYENEGFFTSCFFEPATCTITYKNPNGFNPSSISIIGATWGSGAKITISTSKTTNFFEISHSTENWENFETDIPEADIEPDMELIFKLEGMFYDYPFAIIDSINVKEKESEETTTLEAESTTLETTTAAELTTMETVTEELTTLETTTEESTTLETTTEDEMTTMETTTEAELTTLETTTTTTIKPSESTMGPIITTPEYIISTTSYTTRESTPGYTWWPPSSTHWTTTRSPDDSTTYEYQDSTTEFNDGGQCKPKTWTTSTTWTDVTQSSNCSHMIEIVTKTLVTTITLQYIN